MADLSGADLSEANLFEADLAEADLRGAKLGLANLHGANLSEADLTDGIGLSQDLIDGANGDEDTKLPDGLERPAHWSPDKGVAV